MNARFTLLVGDGMRTGPKNAPFRVNHAWLTFCSGLPPMKLLLIEDHVPVANVLTEVFQDSGHQVSVAHTGEEGLRELVDNCPDAVLLDVTLPGMDGVTVLRAIRAHDRQLPVIVLSGNVTPEQIEELSSLGVHDVIHKPDTLSHLTEVLALLSGRVGRGRRAPDDQDEGR